eukprot:CAMPEP_0176353386 /NCGR_PEP_ID=MMETSP0126-20121128/11741_1 /TAXON_ID=141414 ORGANISM="Strombidinopsis acuminatum, Strain SPMC142" /NCGR_SAMPLE_ID=MMETSP0126 /ASSEMBLY_ACC=CAM_ASM_000229 /LENGTH=41 /DNA_ID= /DNA_START= /DNA_END= /DNA_ORIENTATION=
MKDGGCPHMTCTLCKYEWCWNCNAPMPGGQHISLVPFGCVG